MASQESFRATKRKLDDAFFELDNSVIAPDSLDGSRPLKRSNTARSIYSTLTKYGISTRAAPPPLTVTPPGLTKPTPHLSAILSRASTRTKNLFSFRSDRKSSASDPDFTSNAEYRPSSIPSFLSRLSTFKLATYANKPSQIDAVAASRCGWTNDGKDRLVCGICGAAWVVGNRDGMSRDAASILVEKQRISLVEAHKNGCPWKSRQCDASIYRIPLQSPAATVRNVKATALVLNEHMKDITVKHPLTLHQVNSVVRTIVSYSIPTASEEAVGERLTTEPSCESAILAALFGWSIIPQIHQNPRKSSFSASVTTPSTPARSASVSLDATPVRFNIPANLFNKRDTLLQCALCQRRIGLWTFLPTTATKSTSTTGMDSPTPATPQQVVPQKQFDLLREHRSYCPYVVRSTAIPSIPVQPMSGATTGSLSKLIQSPQDGTLEGWRVVLTIILRYGLGQKQSSERDIFAPEGDSEDPAEQTETDESWVFLRV
ncbi:hypothetical protein AGABI1DRAFT_128887 [Agaricus bisporus var. burnettii JB137-S8]|uniref:C3HC-type domain-containing protein n=1 Tax=Agaricus bisporus var. burnettii (strain JB137-S8 / ATCC MYA-4627 / FGSC 10392) TaxID=597362 RepID=K5XU73_AGABU|nr:uncharacterized protein AGABI1DRAFT_128887 [Agaricus bisporus var. burnettii JB137-S8]EKM78600.1 hypothetical protein AGABI1DRAFT_128887 [Agaricus bisporus var. burnettii JB137-S8]